MTSHHRLWLWICVIQLILIVFCARELSLLGDGSLHAYFLDVGQGDSALLVSPSGKQIIIDGGPDSSARTHLGRLMPFFDLYNITNNNAEQNITVSSGASWLRPLNIVSPRLLRVGLKVDW